MNIRLINENDYPAIFDIYAHSKLDELRFEEKAFKLLPLEEDEYRFAELIKSEVYVCEDASVIGYGALLGSEIKALFVCPKARGKGVGKGLLEFLLSRITGSANLYVVKSNAPAKQLYFNFGFKVTNEFQAEYNGVSVLANEMIRA